jgi:hypothetical protein
MLSKTSFELIVILLLTLLLTEACKEKSIDDPEMKKYVDELIKERKEKDYSLQFDINSPFNRDTTITLFLSRSFSNMMFRTQLQF